MNIKSSSLPPPQVLEDVTGEEFVLLMRLVSGLRVLQTVNGRQQLVELVVDQAFLEQALNPADPDTVDRLLQCTRQALPLFSVSVKHKLSICNVLECLHDKTKQKTLAFRSVFLMSNCSLINQVNIFVSFPVEKCPFHTFCNLLL